MVQDMLRRKVFRWAFTAAILLAGLVASVNFEELLKYKGWDKKLVELWPVMMSVVSAMDSAWVIYVFAFLLGCTFTAWVYRFLPEENQPAATTPPIANGPVQVRPEPVDYEGWDSTYSFTVLDAACLWCEVEPSDFILINQSQESVIWDVVNMILEAAGAGFIILDTTTNPLPDRVDPNKSKVSRNNLRSFAEGMGKKPKFLFEESR